MGAAYLINGGASDDGFEYFCRWLIGQGKAVFEGGLAEPDNLAELIKDDIKWGDAELDCEDLGYAAMDAYEKKMGHEMPSEEERAYPGEPVGTKWDKDDLDALYPRVAAKLGAMP